jgi:hypothetical protein
VVTALRCWARECAIGGYAGAEVNGKGRSPVQGSELAIVQREHNDRTGVELSDAVQKTGRRQVVESIGWFV